MNNVTKITPEELKRRGWHDTGFGILTLPLLRDDHDSDALAVTGNLPFIIIGGRCYHMLHLTTMEQLEQLYALLTGGEMTAVEEAANEP